MEPSAEHDRRDYRFVTSVVMLIAACLTLVSWVVWQTVPPQWTTMGYPSYLGYGKNVEHLALLASALTAFCLCMALPYSWLRPGWTCVLLLGALGVVYAHCSADSRWLPPVMLLGNVAYFSWYYRQGRQCPAQSEWSEPWSRVVSIAIFAWALFLGWQQGLKPKPLDMFHQGESIVSAQDWLAGGKPYETMFWPHGLHDTGTTALFGQLTGNLGLGADVLAKTLFNMLGLTAAMLILRNVLRRWSDAAVVAWLIAACFPLVLFWLSRSVFAVLAWHLLARSTSARTLFVAGLLLGWNFLWRFDHGAYALAATAFYLAWQPFYFAYRDSDLGWRVVFDRACYSAAAVRLGVLATGTALCMAASWATFGVPNATMMYITLCELPAYHADNTGIPLMLPLRGFESYAFGSFRLASWVTTQTLLFAVGIAVFLMLKARAKRIRLALAEDHFCLMMSLFCLFGTKTLLDRCDLGHAYPVLTVWVLLFAYDLAARCTWHWPHTARLGVLATVTIVFVGALFHQLPVTQGVSSLLLREGLNAVWQNRPQFGVAQSLATLRQCISPSRRWEDLLEPTEFPDKSVLQEEVRQLRRLLERHAIGRNQLLATHSGPLLYPLLDRVSPTRYYMLGWAMNDRMQREAVGDLEASQVLAVLRLNGYGTTMPVYDVPDEHRVPLIHDYLSQRMAGWQAYHTGLGTLYVADAQHGYAGYRLHRQATGDTIDTPHATIRVVNSSLSGHLDSLSCDSEYISLAGWSGDTTQGTPAEQVLVFLDEQCVFRSPLHALRPDVARAVGQPRLLVSGFNLKIPRRCVASDNFNCLRIFTTLGNRATELRPPAGTANIAESASESQRR